jgi:hypothetical protein
MPELSGYRHQLGVHCGSTALRNLSAHYTGQRWSEALCFGLAAGMNFTYVREPGSPFFLVMGRGSFTEGHFCEALDILMEVTHSDDADLAWHSLRQQVDAGIPMMIDVDMFELPYMVQALNLMEGVHFGGHKAIVTGYDADRGLVYLADYAWRERQAVTLSQLAAARDSRACPSRPRNAAFRFHFPQTLPPMGDAVRAALATMVNQMRHPYMEFNGLPAIARFCRQVPAWPLALQGEALQRNAELAAFMLEKAGSGGGAFRNIFSRFLYEAAELLGGVPLLHSAAAIYRQLAGQWREAAQLLIQASRDPATGMFQSGPAARTLMREIALNEVRGIDTISDYLLGSGR